MSLVSPINPIVGLIILFNFMFSVNNFYDYLIHSYGMPKKRSNIFTAFRTAGDRNFYNMLPLDDSVNIAYPNSTDFHGAIYLFDQEPIFLDRDNFKFESFEKNFPKFNDYLQDNPNDQMKFLAIRFNKSIFCHSEENSKELEIISDGFLTAHYFYHGLISRDWFRHYRHFNIKKNKDAKRFGLYIRDTSGTRQYRKNLLNRLHSNRNVYYRKPPGLKLDCHWPESDQLITSEHSAKIDWKDLENFQIQIVAETLFETKRTHLTEKVFKPIVMHQPFILFAGPNSLQYLKRYGFKTFSEFWDESYDNILDDNLRFEKILELIDSLSKLSDSEFNHLLERIQPILDHNQKHFYSNNFEESMLNELHTNITSAIHEQDEYFKIHPGEPALSFFDKLIKKNLIDQSMSDYFLRPPMHHCSKHFPKETKVMLKKYPWLSDL